MYIHACILSVSNLPVLAGKVNYDRKGESQCKSQRKCSSGESAAFCQVSQGLTTFPFFAWAMQRAGNEEGRHAEGRQ